MAKFQILYHSEVVRRDIPSLDPPVRQRIKAAIEQRLTTRPEDFAKPLAYTLPPRENRFQDGLRRRSRTSD